MLYEATPFSSTKSYETVSCDSAELRILILEPFSVLRLGMKQLLEERREPLDVEEAVSTRDALPKLRQERVELIIWSLPLSERLRREELQALRAACPGAAILVQAHLHQLPDIEAILQAGELDALLDPACPVRDFRRTVEELLQGGKRLPRSLLARYSRGSLPARDEQGRVRMKRLSDRECQVFQLIGCGLINHEIAAVLSLSVKTIETYREHLKEKFCLANAKELKESAMLWVQQGRLPPENVTAALRGTGRQALYTPIGYSR